MITRRRNPLKNLFIIILLGVISGVAFLIYDAPKDAESRVDAVLVSTPTISIAPTQEYSLPVTIPAVLPTPAKSTMLYIPAAAVSAPIVEVFIDGDTWNIDSLGTNVGHLYGTSWFNQTGNIVLTAHVEMSNGGRGIFASLTNLEIGDVIIVEHEGSTLRYIVSELKTVKPDDLTPLYPTTEQQLTLITCDAYDFFSNEYLERIIVIANPAS